ncbi:MAG: methyltransferase domain-containing protein [Nanoarchaeota archaeon]
MARQSAWNFWNFNGFDLELYFCTEILKLNSLHYGYWLKHESLTIENLRKAQQRYTDTLLHIIPENVSSVLDVGCGIGDVSRSLVHKGYVVDCLSPDKNHTRFFTASPENLHFFNQKFEEFSSGKKYDLILMSESQNYFDPEQGFLQCTRHLKPNGYLLVSGMFRKKQSKEYANVTNIEKEYVRRARSHKFQLHRKLNITQKILPTLHIAGNALQENKDDIPGLIDKHLSASSPLQKAVLKLLFKTQSKQVQKTVQYYQERTNPALFLDKVSYLRLLFQKC